MCCCVCHQKDDQPLPCRLLHVCMYLLMYSVWCLGCIRLALRRSVSRCVVSERYSPGAPEANRIALACFLFPGDGRSEIIIVILSAMSRAHVLISSPLCISLSMSCVSYFCFLTMYVCTRYSVYSWLLSTYLPRSCSFAVPPFLSSTLAA